MAKAPPKTPAADGLALLRGGPDGVKKWNKLTVAARKKVKLSGADLGKCDLTGANLKGLTANKASFAGATLAGARLDGGAFDDTDFRKAVLTGANLSGSHFRRGRFGKADLSNADLSGVSLLAADLTGATLAGAAFTDGYFDAATKWPKGFVIPAEWMFHGNGDDPRLAKLAKKGAQDIHGLMTRLHATIDAKRMKRTLDMLKGGKNQLFAEVEPTLVRGVVRSQTEEDLVYSCVLTDDGTYACCTPDVRECLGLRGEPCKHLLVLLIGLARAGELDPATADKWVLAAKDKNHRWNKTTKNHVSETLLRYKGVQAGEVDWRPTETIPEDYYAM